jgi:formate C-acetyltransferase
MFEQPIFVGFATTVDSLVALSELVYKEKKLSLEEFSRIVAEDFEGNESLRHHIIKNLSHYGNDDPVADGIAARLAASLQGIFDRSVVLWDNMMPGTFSYINHASIGKSMGATFDGRRAYTSYSDGCSAAQGRDVNGPTAMLLSLTSWDQSALLGGMVVNIKFGKDSLDQSKIDSFLALVRVFMERGGIEMQVNVVDRATLEDSRTNPEAHRDLIVRIGGYSDYFTRLSPVLQQEIIDRTEY